MHEITPLHTSKVSNILLMPLCSTPRFPTKHYHVTTSATRVAEVAAPTVSSAFYSPPSLTGLPRCFCSSSGILPSISGNMFCSLWRASLGSLIHGTRHSSSIPELRQGLKSITALAATTVWSLHKKLLLDPQDVSSTQSEVSYNEIYLPAYFLLGPPVTYIET